jgi:hypothetical protein
MQGIEALRTSILEPHPHGKHDSAFFSKATQHIHADRLQGLVLDQSGSAATWGSAARSRRRARRDVMCP